MLSYAKEVVECIKGKADWVINPIVLDIKYLSLSFYSIELFHIPRTVNGGANNFGQVLFFSWQEFSLESLFFRMGMG